MGNEDNHKKKNSFHFTPQEKEKYMKELSSIYYRCLMGRATEEEMKIAQKFSPALIETLRKEYLQEETMEPETEKEETEMKEMWKQVTAKLNIDYPLLPSIEEQRYTDAYYREAYEVEQKAQKRKRKIQVLYRYTAIAGMVALIIITGMLLNSKHEKPGTGHVQLAQTAVQTYLTTPSEQRKELLADGTQVDLNRGSSLELSTEFGKKSRDVKMEGQIFFDVTKDPSGKTFLINAPDISITVLGTAFEVVSYEEIPEKTVTVCRGCVEVRNAESGKLLATLTKGMKLVYDTQTREFEVKKVDAEMVTAWREGGLILHNASLPELELRIKQYFGKELVIEDNALRKDVRITSSFSYEEATVQNIMDRICALFGTQGRIEGNRVIISPVNNI